MSWGIHINARTEGFPAEHCIEIINLILFAHSPSVMWLIHVHMIKAWSTNVHHVKSKSDFKSNFKMQIKEQLQHRGLVLYAGKRSPMSIQCSFGFHGLFLQKASKQAHKEQGASPALVNNPTRCIMVLHLSFYL